MTANACFMATVHLLTSAQKMFVFTSVFITAFHPARGSCPGQGRKRKCGTPSDDKNGDDGSQSKKRPVQPKAKAATQKTVCKGKRPAAKTKAKK